jgi:hypothetical protein
MQCLDTGERGRKQRSGTHPWGAAARSRIAVQCARPKTAKVTERHVLVILTYGSRKIHS